MNTAFSCSDAPLALSLIVCQEACYTQFCFIKYCYSSLSCRQDFVFIRKSMKIASAS